ncbi:MAG: bifunctional proline dehydrogenase/L-glutamate gamma-semialdehyde dehydrogenase PutA [Azospirillum sp.]|nr:bifunctional proline dehydrogenase/L-glutamate gamma-semialdehyde dehydrogenase PutA [Azospirillum sp.]
MTATTAADLRNTIRRATLADETTVVEHLLGQLGLSAEAQSRIDHTATRLVEGVRRNRSGFGQLDAFIQEFGLTNKEGVALMCLAEALLRIPDPDTANRLIRDKIGGADWYSHLGHADSLFVNASTFALMLTGRVVSLDAERGSQAPPLFDRLVARLGEPVIRQAMVQAMRILGRQFVLGRTIGEALNEARELERRGYRHSYDMLGEAARTQGDADRHFQHYRDAIAAIGAVRDGRTAITGPGISVKLSALHPRLEFGQRDRVLRELRPRLHELALGARSAGIGLTVDTEEADRLDLTLDLIEAVHSDPSLDGWEGFGLALQAYQKRALPVVDWLAELARRNGRRLMVRLVKGAYWDAEIKRGQERGLPGYPVFTRKPSTDLSYLVCAKRLLDQRDRFFPQFATHNAQTAAAVIELAGDRTGYEFQRLHGMGEPLFDQIVGPLGIPCRIYAPVGNHEDLLSYLVRRLLENGANSSFVNRIRDLAVPVAEIIADPVAKVAGYPSKPHPRIPLPAGVYGSERRNSAGLDLADPLVTQPLLAALDRSWARPWRAAPLVDGKFRQGVERAILDPADRRRVVGTVVEARQDSIDLALATAARAVRSWAATPAVERAGCLDRAAQLFEDHHVALIALIVREGGRTIPDALSELREAVDFLRYYAALTRRDFAAPRDLPGPTGETNQLSLHGRGVFVCISPWNFPLAIFVGQVAAALAAGNAVLAKPAEQTPLVAAEAVRLLLEAGVPPAALHLLPGDGATVGARLVSDPRIAGVAFTGSTETARLINRTLAARLGPIVPLIAETGGQNAMIVDSSALPEQVIDDVVTSAFRSAGQRCSSLRVLFLQDDIADRLIAMLHGASAELKIGDPGRLDSDIGPVIDLAARDQLIAHAQRMNAEARQRFALPLPTDCLYGSYFAPCCFEIDRIGRLEREVFGPILHVVRYAGDRLDQILGAIESTGYGLTLGVHSRIERTQREICERLPAGNRYVNRSMIGAVVGVQPFGGEGLSGTGPKAGGPHYLLRFATERTLTINTTAAGGNTALVSIGE